MMAACTRAPSGSNRSNAVMSVVLVQPRTTSSSSGVQDTMHGCVDLLGQQLLLLGTEAFDLHGQDGAHSGGAGW